MSALISTTDVELVVWYYGEPQQTQRRLLIDYEPCKLSKYAPLIQNDSIISRKMTLKDTSYLRVVRVLVKVTSLLNTSKKMRMRSRTWRTTCLTPAGKTILGRRRHAQDVIFGV